MSYNPGMRWLGAALLLLPSLLEARDTDGRALRGINLLRVLRLPEDSVRGASVMEGGVLDLRPSSLVKILYQPPEEYELRIDAERKDLQGKLVVGLVSGEHQFDVVIDNFNENEHRSGMHNLDGKHVVDRENDILKGGVLVNDKVHVIVCSVRKGRVAVRVDAKEIFRWEGDFSRLNIDRRCNVFNARAMFVGNAISRYRITRMELLPLGPLGRSLR